MRLVRRGFAEELCPDAVLSRGGRFYGGGTLHEGPPSHRFRGAPQRRGALLLLLLDVVVGDTDEDERRRNPADDHQHQHPGLAFAIVIQQEEVKRSNEDRHDEAAARHRGFPPFPMAEVDHGLRRRSAIQLRRVGVFDAQTFHIPID